MEVLSRHQERMRLWENLRKRHNKLLTDLSDYLVKGTTIHEKWKYLVSKQINKSMENIKDRSVLEDFDDLESVGKLSPGKYDVLKEILENIEMRAIERIQQTEDLMEEKSYGISAFLPKWRLRTLSLEGEYWRGVILHFDDIFDEVKMGSIGKLKVASSDAYASGHFDTGYNFLISEAGNIYEDRGWKSKGKSGDGLDVCFLGSDTCKTKQLTPAAKQALTELVSYGKEKGLIPCDYNLPLVMPLNSKRKQSLSDDRNQKRPKR